MNRAQWLWGVVAIYGASAVGLGAWRAHGLANLLDADQLATISTAVTYQFYHTLALCLCGFGVTMVAEPAVRRAWGLAAAFMILGTFAFSGSLYALVWLEWRWLGPVTPLGGLSMIAGWLGLGRAGWLTVATYRKD